MKVRIQVSHFSTPNKTVLRTTWPAVSVALRVMYPAVLSPDVVT